MTWDRSSNWSLVWPTPFGNCRLQASQALRQKWLKAPGESMRRRGARALANDAKRESPRSGLRSISKAALISMPSRGGDAVHGLVPAQARPEEAVSGHHREAEERDDKPARQIVFVRHRTHYFRE